MYRIKQKTSCALELDVPDFDSRFQKLFKSGVKVVYIKNEFDNSTFRYRAYNVAQSLEKQNHFVVTYFKSCELEKISRYIKNMDLVILQRAMWDIHIENFIYLAKENSIPVIYDVDDLIINPKYVPFYLNNLGILNDGEASHDVHFNFAAKYYTAASKCDGFIVTNRFLADIIEGDFTKPTWIIPNFLNKEQEYHSKIIRGIREKDKSKFLIGYFSGSPSHRYDLDIIVDSVKALLEKYDDIYFKIVGFIDMPKKLLEFGDRIIQTPFVSYQDLQYEVGEVDLNLVPLQNNLFNNCKSELKYFEAGIVKVPSCCSPTYVYKEIVKEGENGFLCREGEWFQKIERIYNGEYDIDKISKNALRTSIDLYGIENQKEKIVEVYKDILEKLESK
jgi:glycosyltransferase involved in cell wall biosynthesis